MQAGVFAEAGLMPTGGLTGEHRLTITLHGVGAPNAEFEIRDFRITRPNQPPIASCQQVTVGTEPGLCTAPASVDHGSVDPEGGPITLEQSPAGPYSLGTTGVILTVTDDQGATASCVTTVTVMDQAPPTVTAALVPAGEVEEDEGRFRVEFSCRDNCHTTGQPSASATLNRIPVANGQVVELERDEETDVETEEGMLKIAAPSFSLAVTCADASGNVGTATATPAFAPDDDGDDDDDDERDDGFGVGSSSISHGVK